MPPPRITADDYSTLCHARLLPPSGMMRAVNWLKTSPVQKHSMHCARFGDGLISR